MANRRPTTQMRSSCPPVILSPRCNRTIKCSTSWTGGLGRILRQCDKGTRSSYRCISFPFQFFCFPTDCLTQGELVTRVPTCERCTQLKHACYRLPEKVCGCCQCDKKPCLDPVMVVGK